MTERNPRQSVAKAEQNTLLSDLQAIDFALQDIVLYLDAYPEEKGALDYYHTLLEKRAGLLESLSPEHPLTIYDNFGGEWNWGKNPWPWEAEAN